MADRTQEALYARIDSELSWSEHELPERERTKHVHRLHPYLGKFPPQLAEALLRRRFAAGALIYDPFAGSGTTLVEASVLGIDAIGCDVSAFNCLLAEVKTTHPDLDGFWDTLSEANVPFVLHVGGGGRLLDPAFHNNAMPVTDHLGGGENVRSKDFLAIPQSPALFLGVLIYDGLFDRFPKLRGGCIEQGAGWVVSWLRQLDYGQRAFKRTEEPLRTLELTPSEYVQRHLKFTPFAGEPVGWMIEQAGQDLFMFSSDYPHPEGGKDPLAKFEETLDGVDDDALARFYRSNMAELLGSRL